MQKKELITGYCPYIKDKITIEAIFTRYAPIGTQPLATFEWCNCPYILECPDSSDCPVALQKTYW